LEGMVCRYWGHLWIYWISHHWHWCHIPGHNTLSIHCPRTWNLNSYSHLIQYRCTFLGFFVHVRHCIKYYWHACVQLWMLLTLGWLVVNFQRVWIV
jgi:hypothetical protein